MSSLLVEAPLHHMFRMFIRRLTSVGIVRVYHIEDAIADRIAAFLHWSDSESLDVAERSTRAARDRISKRRLDAALDALEPGDTASLARMAIARDRLAAALHPDLSPPTL